jgi:hypothetical protein
MGRLLRTVAAIRFALATRRDLLLETLALRHQLAVLARSNRRFRVSDRWLWLILRRTWPRWRDALVLVQPTTVERWHRDGFARWWRRRRRRPGRPRIDAHGRDLIHQIAAENRFWGAPRIHGELLTLGIAVSERTVSRYLPHRRRAPSQTWRTFLANHFGQLPFVSSSTSPNAPGVDDVVDVSGVTFHSPWCRDGLVSFDPCAVVDWPASLERTSPGMPIVCDHRHERLAMRHSSGRDPPTLGRVAADTQCLRRGSCIGPLATNDRVTPWVARAVARESARLFFYSVESAIDVIKATVCARSAARTWMIHNRLEYWRNTTAAAPDIIFSTRSSNASTSESAMAAGCIFVMRG